MRSSTFLYGLTLTCSGSVYNLLLIHLASCGPFHPSVSKATIRQTMISYRVGCITYAVAMLTALFALAVSFGLYLLVVGYYLFPRGADADLTGKAAPE